MKYERIYKYVVLRTMGIEITDSVLRRDLIKYSSHIVNELSIVYCAPKIDSNVRNVSTQLGPKKK